MRKLFGTDGIRGVAGEYPLDDSTTLAIGQAIGCHLRRSQSRPRVIIGQDTRQSSPALSHLVRAGLGAAGVESENAGVITTPGVAFLARTGDFAAGVVISASHNPWQDNGIKVFGHDGYKLPDQVELEIEAEIFRLLEQKKTGLGEIAGGVEAEQPGLHADYVRWLAGHVRDLDLARFNILVDCANGAATPIAPELFAAAGIRASFIHNAPDGRNINANCGALHPEVVAAEVRRANAQGPVYDLGVTFDGDADRALFCDSRGNLVNGDGVLLLLAIVLQSQGALAGDTVVATTMSNMGLEIALRNAGIRMLRAPVGDKYVLEEMQRTGAVLGGEQSGHIIFRDGDATTGDGLLTALRVLAKMARSGRSLDQLVCALKLFPQVIRNIRVREKKPLLQIPGIAAAIRAAESELGDRGRIVVRYSGTEALARVMVEAESEELMARYANAISDVIQIELGV